MNVTFNTLLAAALALATLTTSSIGQSTKDMSKICGPNTVWNGTLCVSAQSLCGTGTTWNGTSCVIGGASPSSPSSPDADSSSPDADSSSSPSPSPAPDSDGFTSITNFSMIAAVIDNCNGGLKVIIQPSSSYGYKLEPSGSLDVTSSGGNLGFKHNGGSTDPVTATVQMPADALNRLSAAKSVGVEIKPGFKVDTISLTASGSGKIYSSSFCAKTISDLTASGSGGINIAIPADCGTVSIKQASGSGSGNANIDSKGEVNGPTWNGSGSGGISVSATGGTLATLVASGSGHVFTKGITVNNVYASGSGTFSADKVNNKQVSGGGREESFRNVASSVTEATLGPQSMQCGGW